MELYIDKLQLCFGLNATLAGKMFTMFTIIGKCVYCSTSEAKGNDIGFVCISL